MRKPILFCVVGKSATGKDTIAEKLLYMNKDIHKLVPITTRPKRSNEIDGAEYKFIDSYSFLEMIEKNSLLEHRSYNVKNADGSPDVWYYGHPKPTDNLNIMIGDIYMVSTLMSMKDYDVYPIYINIPDQVRLYRMIIRELQFETQNFMELSRRYCIENEEYTPELLKEVGITIDNTFFNYDLDNCVNSINLYIRNIEKKCGE